MQQPELPVHRREGAQLRERDGVVAADPDAAMTPASAIGRTNVSIRSSVSSM